MKDSKSIGKICREYREDLNVSLDTIADELDYTRQNIHHFECGNNRNYNILLWYLEHGLEVYKIL